MEPEQKAASSLGNNHVSPNSGAPEPQTPYRSAPYSETYQPGLEVVPSTEHDKQAVQAEKEVADRGQDFESREKQVVEPLIQPDGHPSLSSEPPRPPRVCGLRRGLFWGALIAGLVFVLGLAIGLGVGLGSDDSDDPTPSSTATSAPEQPSPTPIDDALKIGGALSDSFLSSEGTWNGSGIATNWQRFASNFEDATAGDNLVMYYQHHSGVIRWMRKTKPGDWVRGPSDSEVVADDAKNSTPITAVHLNEDGKKLWHVFYIDKDDRIRQRSGSNSSTSWTDGPINEANLTAYRGDLVGLHACWAGIGPNTPIRLWYASDNTTFEEYLFQEGKWERQRSWDNYNGAAGVGCYSWSRGDNIYVAFTNTDNDVEIWYQNPISSDSAGWRQTDVVIRDVHPATSISLSMFACVVQMRDTNELQVSRMTWEGADTSRQYNQKFSLEGVVDSVGGTHLVSYSSGNGTGGHDIHIFNQIHGDDLTEFKREKDDLTGTWSQNNIAVR